MFWKTTEVISLPMTHSMEVEGGEIVRGIRSGIHICGTIQPTSYQHWKLAVY